MALFWTQLSDFLYQGRLIASFTSRIISLPHNKNLHSLQWLFRQMTTAIAIEDVRREVKILKALSGHENTVKFYDAFEDAQNIYIVMEYAFFLLHQFM